MATNDEKQRVAERLREYASWDDDGSLVDCQEWGESVLNLLDCGDTEGECYEALADLIEPDNGFDLDTVQRVCFECMEGCDEPEYTLYSSIYDAIARYKRGESGIPAAQVCDREALLRLADELDARAVELLKLNDLDRSRQRRSARTDHAGDLMAACGRIREACGVTGNA